MEVDKSSYLTKIINKTQKGLGYFEIISFLINNYNIDNNEAEQFIDELVSSKILVSEIEPNITGEEYYKHLLHKLNRINCNDEIICKLNKINKLLSLTGSNHPNDNLKIYKSIISEIDQIGAKYDKKCLFQVDLTGQLINKELTSAIQNDLIGALTILNKLSTASNNSILKDFKSSFFARYEDNEVPISVLMDTEIGIGYRNNAYRDGSSFLEDINLPSENKEAANNVEWRKIDTFLLKKIEHCLQTDEYCLEIQDKELNGFNVSWDDLPPTMSAICKIYNCNNNLEIFFNMVAGPSAINLLGRFCHYNSHIYEYAREIAKKEESLLEPAIIAEIAYLPAARIGNIMQRPVFHKYEIPYLVTSALGKSNQILLSDIMVSLRNDKVYLRSKKYNKQIIPRLSTAHNFSFSSMPIYHFLCDVQNQTGRNSLEFHWGCLSDKFDFLPRVYYKNIILSPARWIIYKSEITDLISNTPEIGLSNKIKSWRIRKKIPQYVTLTEDDNELFIDLNSLIFINMFLSICKNKMQFILTEFLFFDKQSIVSDIQNNQYSNEFIFSFFKNIS